MFKPPSPGCSACGPRIDRISTTQALTLCGQAQTQHQEKGGGGVTCAVEPNLPLLPSIRSVVLPLVSSEGLQDNVTQHTTPSPPSSNTHGHATSGLLIAFSIPFIQTQMNGMGSTEIVWALRTERSIYKIYAVGASLAFPAPTQVAVPVDAYHLDPFSDPIQPHATTSSTVVAPGARYR